MIDATYTQFDTILILTNLSNRKEEVKFICVYPGDPRRAIIRRGGSLEDWDVAALEVKPTRKTISMNVYDCKGRTVVYAYNSNAEAREEKIKFDKINTNWKYVGTYGMEIPV